ncbi:MAG: ABC transporter ATP-binding protein [Microvirga sp.]
MQPIIAISKLSKTYASGFEALKGIDLSIRPGEIFALLGPNGAGKTTLISIVCGIVNPTAGTVTADGHDIIADYRAARAKIGLVPQELTTDAFETVWATVSFSRGLFGKRRNPAHIERVLRDLSLWDKKDSKIMTLSGGMKRRVMIAKALSHEPQILFLDEPTAGVDVELRRALWRYVRVLRDRGTTIVLTTHYLDEAEELADRIGVIDRGRLLVVDDKKALLRRYAGKTLRATLAAPLVVLPPQLAALGARLEDEGRTVALSVEPGASFGPALAAFAQAGLSVQDVETTRMRLEEVFVRLLRGDGAASAAAARTEAP